MGQYKEGEAPNTLRKCLDSLIEALQQGDWERIPDFSDELLPALEAVRNPALVKKGLLTAPQIKQLLEKLQLAMTECQERKSQIAPLVEALTKNNSLREP